jgi:hypothetical protein
VNMTDRIPAHDNVVIGVDLSTAFTAQVIGYVLRGRQVAYADLAKPDLLRDIAEMIKAPWVVCICAEEDVSHVGTVVAREPLGDRGTALLVLLGA